MVKKRVKFTFLQNLITEPVIHNLGQDFKVVTNIRRADVRDDMGWVVLELEGDDEEITRGLEWFASDHDGVYNVYTYDPISGDVVEG